MTREEAIQVLDKYKRYAESIYTDGIQESKAFDMAIKSLQADTVSRTQYQGLLNAIGKVYVEVVRCNDCRHYEDGMIGYCWEVDRGVSADFFCAYGERREE